MKRVILLFAAVLLASVGWSQTMNIHYKNGQTVQYNINNIDYVEYTENNPNNAQVSSGEAVDLGLSVLWASCNVGATSPEEFGDRYAWGETSTKDSYSLSSYVYYDKDSETFVDIGTDIKGTDYDVAHVKWGRTWRMPTEKEMIELKNNCNLEWYNLNGVKGFKVTGKNGNSIFIPVGNAAHYWASTIHPTALKGKYDSAGGLLLASSTFASCLGDRYKGDFVRPVKSK